MDNQTDGTIQRISQFLTTEHFTLQGARNGTISESNGRLSAYLTTVSMSIIALSFVAQVSRLGPVFLGFSIVIFPILMSLGIATLIRLTQLGISDVLLIQAINRIRHYYLEMAPGAEPYLSYPHFDDAESILSTVVPIRVAYEGFGSAGFQVAVLNSFLAGAFAGILAAGLLALDALPSIATGVGGMILAFLLQGLFGAAMGKRIERSMEVRFPRPLPSSDA